MIKIEYREGRQLKEKEVNFKDAIDLIVKELDENIKQLKQFLKCLALKG